MTENMVVVSTISTFVLLQLSCAFMVRRSLKARLEAFEQQIKRSSSGMTRADLVERVDQIAANNVWYTGLQRLTIIAPLVGVVYTAVSFMVVDIPGLALTGEGTDPSLAGVTGQLDLGSIRPLFYGVALGAGLAILNQVFLQMASRTVWSLQEATTETLAASRVVGTAPATNGEAVERAIENFVTDLDKMLGLMGGAVERIKTQSESYIDGMGSAIETWSARMNAVAKECRASSKSLVDATDTLKDGFGSVLSGVSEELGTIGEAVKESSAAVKSHGEKWGEILVTADATVKKAFEGLTANSDSLRELLAALSEASSQSMSRIEASSRFAEESLEATASLARQVDSNVGPALVDAAESIRSATESCQTGGDELANSARSLTSTSTNLAGSIAEIRSASEPLSEVVGRLGGLSSDLEETRRKLEGGAMRRRKRPVRKQGRWFTRWFRRDED